MLRAAGPRRILPELLDDAPADEARRNLADLARINALFGGYSTLRWAVGQVARRSDSFSVLDIGAASGDNGRALLKQFPNVLVTSLDYRLLHLEEADPPRIVGDAFRLPVRDGSFDVVMCSLFLHHFEDDEIVSLLAAFKRLARRSVVVTDLYRNPFAYYFIPATAPILRWGRLVRHDGPISVEAAFRPNELAALAERAGLSGARVRLHLPWMRLSMVYSR
jgi:SAM-dependent methyltransferase